MVAQQSDIATTNSWSAANATCANGWSLPSTANLDAIYAKKGLSTNLPQSGRYWSLSNGLSVGTKQTLKFSIPKRINDFLMTGTVLTRCVK